MSALVPYTGPNNTPGRRSVRPSAKGTGSKKTDCMGKVSVQGYHRKASGPTTVPSYCRAPPGPPKTWKGKKVVIVGK